MNRKSFLVGLLVAGCFVATSTLMTSPGNAQADPKVAKAMEILKAETAKLGAPKVEGTDQTADKTTPGLYFGSTKVNNDFTIVDKVKAEAGGTATLFVKSGDDYVRVSTNVPGSVLGRAQGTILDPNGHCGPSFFENCSSAVAKNMTGSTLFVGAPTGTFDLLSFLLTGSVPHENRCFPPP